MVIADKGGGSSLGTSAKERALVEGMAASAESQKVESVAAAAETLKTSTAAETLKTSTAAETLKADSEETSTLPASASLVSTAYAYAQAQATPETTRAADIWSRFKISPKHDQIVATSPDVFKSLPEFFSSRFKNPCWFQVGNS